MKKEAGILLPIFSLPNLDGIGSFGKEAYEMVDYVKACGFSYLQVLFSPSPVHPDTHEFF